MLALGGTLGDTGNAIAITPEGNIVVTGTTSFGAGGQDVLVAQYYANGTFAWAKTLGGVNDDAGNALALSPEGTIVVAGYTQSFGAGSYDVLLAQYYPNGTFAWAQTLGGISGDVGLSLAIAPDGCLLLTGLIISFGAGNEDVLLAKFQSDGSLTWAQTLGGTLYDRGYSLVIAPDGSLALTGYTNSFGAGSFDVLLAKFQTSGTFAWAKILGGTNNDGGLGVVLSPEGNIVITGYTYSFGAGADDVLVAQYYSNGTFAWAKTLGGTQGDCGYVLTLSPEGSIIVTGQTYSFGTGNLNGQVLVAQLNTTGGLSFNHSFLLQSIPSIQDQSWSPTLSTITTLVSLSSCPGIIYQSWTSVSTSNIHPSVTLLYPDPSATPSASLTPSHRGSPARRRLEVY